MLVELAFSKGCEVESTPRFCIALGFLASRGITLASALLSTFFFFLSREFTLKHSLCYTDTSYIAVESYLAPIATH